MPNDVKLKPCPNIMPLRFMNKIEFAGDCWIWIGAKNNKGYGHIGVNGKTILAHRFSYSFQYGGIPKGMTLDHQCRNRSCVNPYHLKPMTQKQNNLLGIGPTAINSKKTHCIHGHSLSGDNLKTYIAEGTVHRRCYICHKNNVKRYDAKTSTRAKEN